MARGGWVYIMADRYRGTLYIGVTSDIAARGAQGRTRLEVLRPLRPEAAGLRRASADNLRSDRARKGDEEMEAGMEDRADRMRQSGLEGPVGARPLIFVTPAKAGVPLL